MTKMKTLEEVRANVQKLLRVKKVHFSTRTRTYREYGVTRKIIRVYLPELNISDVLDIWKEVSDVNYPHMSKRLAKQVMILMDNRKCLR